MTAKDIIESLYRHYCNYEYKLNNTFVFNWESDFFAMSSSNYFIECEVKISRGDFFVDFKKDKHRLFTDITGGKSHHIYRNGESNWEIEDRNIIGKVEWYQLMTDFGDFQDNNSRKRECTMISCYWPSNWKRGVKNGKPGYWVNDFGNVRLIQLLDVMRAHFCKIRIQPISEIPVPNQFYYAVPKGLVKVQEIPKYAGLLTIDKDGQVDVLKRAPYMHKRKMDMDKTLLKKYYHLWQYKVPYETKMAIRNNYSENQNL
jgi:hypothetical protein